MKYYLFLWISMNQDQLFSISTTTQSQFYFIIACLLCEFPNHTIILNIHKNWRFSFSTNLCVYFHSILLQLIYFHDFCFLFYFSVTIVVCYFTGKKRQVDTGKGHILRILHISADVVLSSLPVVVYVSEWAQHMPWEIEEKKNHRSRRTFQSNSLIRNLMAITLLTTQSRDPSRMSTLLLWESEMKPP